MVSHLIFTFGLLYKLIVTSVLYFGASDGVLKHMFALGYRLPAFKSWTELIEVCHWPSNAHHIRIGRLV